MSPSEAAFALTEPQSRDGYSETEAERAPPMQTAEKEPTPQTRIVSSRIGDVETPEANVLRFPRGVLGFETGGEFVILNLPHPGMEQFRLLQSCDDAEVGFIVVEASGVASALDPADLQEAYKQCEVRPTDALTLLIVTVRKSEDGVELSANLRAPIVIDIGRKVGRQHVMANGKYPVRFGL